MTKTLTFIARLIIIDFVFFLVFFLYLQNRQKSSTTARPRNINIVSPSATPTPQESSSPAKNAAATSQAPDLFAELPKHNSPSDCWMKINGHLYNITPYFGQHPGGDGALAKYCGTDATVGFNTKDRSPGVAHSGAAEAMLQQFLIQ